MKAIQVTAKGRPLGGMLSQWWHFRLIPFVTSLVVRLLSHTLRIRYEGREHLEDLFARDERLILAFWHRRLLMMPLAYPTQISGNRRRGIAILSSQSRDGERSAATWRWFHIHAIRGSANEDGARALAQMMKAVREGWDIGLTPDGPKGPAQEAKPGIIALAQKSGASILPVCIAYDRFITLGSWDAMIVPMPFAQCTVRYAPPMKMDNGLAPQAGAQQLTHLLNDLETWANEGRS